MDDGSVNYYFATETDYNYKAHVTVNSTECLGQNNVTLNEITDLNSSS